MGLQRFPLSDFVGGVNLQDGPFDLGPNEAQNARNIVLSQRGALSERAGKTRFDSSGFPSAKRAEFTRNWYQSGTRLLMASIDGTIYKFSTSGAATSVFAGTAAKVWDFEAMLNVSNSPRLWAMNGTDNPKKYDGTTVSDWANSPPNGTMMRVWRNRMLIAGVAGSPQRLFYSDVGDPESPVTTYGTNWVDIRSSEDDDDPITWLEVQQEYAVVFKKRSVWVVYDPVAFNNRRIGGPGCEDRFQSAELLGKIYYLARDGIYSVDGSGPPRYESRKLGPLFASSVNMASISKARLAPTRDRRLLVAVPTGADNDLLLEYVPDLGGWRKQGKIVEPPWMIHDFKCSSLATFRPVNTDVVIAGASDAAKLHTLFAGTNDDGVAIDAYWFGPWNRFLSEEPLERLRRLNVEKSGDCTVECYTDLNGSAPVFTASIPAPVVADPLWDGGTWDGGVWEAGSATHFKRVRPECHGRYHAIKFRNNQLDKTFTIYAVEAAIRGGKEH